MYIYESEHLGKEDLLNIERCGKKCLPIYYRSYQLEMFLKGTKQRIWVLKDHTNLYGFLIFEIKSSKNIHILSIAVEPDYQNKKLASYLMNELKKKYSSIRITLFVQISNLKAINFYIKQGFTFLEFLPNYYNNLPVSSAYKMIY